MAPDLWSPAPRRIAVFRALALGDLLCAVPALRALRAHAPAAHITLIGLPWAETFVERFHAYLDDFLPFPGYPGYPEREGTIPAFLDFLRAAHARRFDLAIQLHGSGELTNRIVALLGAPRIAGFVNNEGQTPIDVPPPANNEGQTPIEVPPSGGQWVSDPHFLPWPAQAPEVHRYLRLMEFLGAAGKGDHLELPLTWTDWEAWEEVAKRHRLRSGAYVCLHPGARLRSRRWPVERFAAVGCALAEDGWQVVVTGSAEEAGLARELMARLPKDAEDLTGQTTLGSLAALVSRGALLICNDTGVSHVAAAVGTPSVVVASGSDVSRWAPLDHELHRVVWHHVACRPCAFDACPVGHPCALGVSVAHVVSEARRVLDGKDVRHAA